MNSAHSPDPASNQNEGVTRRQVIKWGGRSIVGLLAAWAGIEIARNLSHQQREHHERTPARPVTPQVQIRNECNRQGLIDMHRQGVQAYCDELHNRERILIPESEVMDVSVNCIDERQTHGTGHGVAGVGVLLSPQQREGIARNIVRKAKEKFERSGKPVTVRIKPHLQGNCGAARKARTDRGELDMSADAIDNETKIAAAHLKALVERIGREEDVPVRVDDDPFPAQSFYADHIHPGGAVLVNTAADQVCNMGRRTGAFFYGVSAPVGGNEIARNDALFAGKIALLSGHGMFDRPETRPPPEVPYRIILAGESGNIAALKKEYEHALRNDRDLGTHFENRRIVVDGWTPEN